MDGAAPAPGVAERTSGRQRMTGSARRDQLLDVAAAAVIDGRMAGLTMERVAELAGVSKALPYTHFTSIDDLLRKLYERESVALGAFIWSALEAADPGADLVRVYVGAYFDGLERSGDVFGALTTPGSTVAAHAGDRNVGARFAARLLRHFLGMERNRSKIVGGIVNAAVLGAGNGWRKRLGTRAELEDCAVHVVRAAVGWKGAPS